jgi:STAS-like domain of unknown function (DUF4325)
MNTQQIALQKHALGSMIGMRSSARPIRLEIEQALGAGQEVVVNFTGVAVTQSFVDELLGALVLRDGPGVFSKAALKRHGASSALWCQTEPSSMRMPRIDVLTESPPIGSACRVVA